MRKAFSVVCTGALLAACSMPSAAPPVPSATNTVDREWRSYVEPLASVGGRLAPLLGQPADPQQRHELYRSVFSYMAAGYLNLFLGDARHPDFWPTFNMAFNMAPDPDDVYYSTIIEPAGSYRISGYRGSVRIMDVNVNSGELFPTGTGTFAPTLASYDVDRLRLGPDGRFEVLLSAERPAGYRGDWWKLDDKATYLLVRQIAYDWAREVDGRIAIERLDQPAIRPRPTAEEIDTALRRVVAIGENWTRFSAEWMKRYRDKGVINKVMEHDIDIGGVASQRYTEGVFALGPGEALIYDTEVPQCRYWSLTLSDMLWGTVDFMNRQTSLNGHTAKLDADGHFRAVIAATDPGVPNWLDTAGHAEGGMLGRWMACDRKVMPVITRVQLSELRQHLPADTPVVTPAQREATQRERREAAQMRRRW